MKDQISAPVSAISRHRIGIDGEGITTLVVFHSCPLRCRWCLNPQTWREGSTFRMMTPQQLMVSVQMDDIYFQATGGGVTFGGGEPALRSRFIEEFRRIAPKQWKINIETSINVPVEHIERLIQVTDEFVIDIKDMDPAIYEEYTGQTNEKVIANLRFLAENGVADRCLIRVPMIPEYNSENDRQNSITALKALGFNRFDVFEYKKDINK
ncbi:MAG: radical SAM protein [Bacteroidales bacterium]|nr:radical SAM protein [Bacteroidales bacterium]